MRGDAEGRECQGRELRNENYDNGTERKIQKKREARNRRAKNWGNKRKEQGMERDAREEGDEREKD